MDKRDFIKSSVATIAVGGAGSALAQGAIAANYSVHELDKLKLNKQASARMFAGSELVGLATATAKNRLWFVADPVGFAAAHQIKVHKGLLEVLQPHILEIDGQFANHMTAAALYEARIGSAGPKSGDTGTALPIALAAAVVQAATSVVQSVAAVVVAVSATYAAFRWNIDVENN